MIFAHIKNISITIQGSYSLFQHSLFQTAEESIESIISIIIIIIIDNNNNIYAYQGLLLQYLWQITQPLFSCRSHQKLPFVLVVFVYHTRPSMEFQDEAIWKTRIWIWPNKKARIWVKKCHLDIQGEAMGRILSNPALFLSFSKAIIMTK